MSKFLTGCTVRHKLHNTVVEVLPVKPMDDDCFAGRYLYIENDFLYEAGKAHDDFLLNNFDLIDYLA